MPSTPYWKLRRLAARAKRVVARRKAELPSMTDHELRLVPLADAFIAAHDDAARYRDHYDGAQIQGQRAVQALSDTMRDWLPALTHDVPGFAGPRHWDTSMPGDVMEAAAQLLEIIHHHRNSDGSSLPYRERAALEIEERWRAAQSAWNSSRAADSHYRSQFSAMHSLAAQLEAELDALRRALARDIGTRNDDYQKLREQRATRPDIDDALDEATGGTGAAGEVLSTLQRAGSSMGEEPTGIAQ